MKRTGVHFGEADARQWLGVYLDVLAGKGCPCVQKGHRDEPCPTVRRYAPMARDAIVDGHPELEAELREAATRILAS